MTDTQQVQFPLTLNAPPRYSKRNQELLPVGGTGGTRKLKSRSFNLPGSRQIDHINDTDDKTRSQPSFPSLACVPTRYSERNLPSVEKTHKCTIKQDDPHLYCVVQTARSERGSPPDKAHTSVAQTEITTRAPRNRQQDL